jgi:hypothetical protein
MHYVFLDESYLYDPTQTKIIMAAWGVEQERWNRQSGSLQLYRTPVLNTILAAFDSLDAHAVIGTAILDNSAFRSGESDGTDDIREMSRTDNVWSHCAIFVVGSLIRDFVGSGQEMETVDIFCDPKSLKLDHLDAVKRALRDLVVPMAKNYAFVRGSKSIHKLSICRIELVKKATAGQVADKFQLGTWVSDKLCSNSDQIAILKPPRINMYDISEPVRKTALQFDGVPFHETA